MWLRAALPVAYNTCNFQRLSNPRQLACYAGIAPSTCTSGTSTMPKQGSATVPIKPSNPSCASQPMRLSSPTWKSGTSTNGLSK
ncbi:MAG: transposase [Bacteroidetes bacterium]|nr:transposase [Bacteroidota bacterium]